MRDYVEIGPAPCNEDCAQVGSENYRAKALAECRRFIELIRATVGPEVGSARLYVKSNSHDFGTYYEVACSFEDEEGADYAYRCEEEAPVTWDVPERTAKRETYGILRRMVDAQS